MLHLEPWQRMADRMGYARNHLQYIYGFIINSLLTRSHKRQLQIHSLQIQNTLLSVAIITINQKFVFAHISSATLLRLRLTTSKLCLSSLSVWVKPVVCSPFFILRRRRESQTYSQDGHLDFLKAPELDLDHTALRPQERGCLLGTGTGGGGERARE